MAESLLTIAQAMKMAGFGDCEDGKKKSSWYAAIRAGKMPKPCKRGRSSVWLESEVQAAVDAEAAEMKAERDRGTTSRRAA